jgi:ATP/maltotriose-dependent transcriptional regulator MalT
MVDLGEIRSRKAEMSSARSNFERAIAMGSQIGDKSTTAYGLMGLGDVEMEQDQLALARKKYESAFKLRTDLGEKQTILQTRVALARLAIEEGHPEQAEPELRQCQDQLYQAQSFDDELAADLVLAEALLDQAKNADARNEIFVLRPLGDANSVGDSLTGSGGIWVRGPRVGGANRSGTGAGRNWPKVGCHAYSEISDGSSTNLRLPTPSS